MELAEKLMQKGAGSASAIVKVEGKASQDILDANYSGDGYVVGRKTELVLTAADAAATLTTVCICLFSFCWELFLERFE